MSSLNIIFLPIYFFPNPKNNNIPYGTPSSTSYRSNTPRLITWQFLHGIGITNVKRNVTAFSLLASAFDIRKTTHTAGVRLDLVDEIPLSVLDSQFRNAAIDVLNVLRFAEVVAFFLWGYFRGKKC